MGQKELEFVTFAISITRRCFELIDNGVVDLHCRSDQFLADEIMIEEAQEKEENGGA